MAKKITIKQVPMFIDDVEYIYVECLIDSEYAEDVAKLAIRDRGAASSFKLDNEVIKYIEDIKDYINE